MQAFLTWADDHHVGCAAWTWDAWQGTCLTLISRYDRSPAGDYGRWVKTYYAG
jgi:hypothetical protein